MALNPHYTFETFVVGPANRLPYAASIAVAEAPGRAYNPLFLHGAVGLGKTHLLQATGHRLLSQARDGEVLYASCEAFVNSFISALEKGTVDEFRRHFRSASVVLIDDVHYLANRERTQEEFFHTFNALYNAQKQIVLSSDSSPQDIESLEERLVSRFKWGLVTRMDPPEFETRRAIVQKKARERSVNIPAEVADLLAERITKNIRELEGAVTTLLAQARLTGRPVDAALVSDVLGELASETASVSIDLIVRSVCDWYAVKPADIQSRKRVRSIAMPRQVCMYLARELTTHSLEEIGGFLGGRDHTTVLYAHDKMAALARSNEKLRKEIKSLTNQIKAVNSNM